jgi:hypothetical protein
MLAMASTLVLGMMAPSTVSVPTTTVPRQFIGRYELFRKNCRVSMHSRQDDENDPVDQGGVLIIKKRSVYFAQWVWPIKNVKSVKSDTILLELINDVDADGKNIEIDRYRFTLRGRALFMTGGKFVDAAGNRTDSQIPGKYYRCGNGI